MPLRKEKGGLVLGESPLTRTAGAFPGSLHENGETEAEPETAAGIEEIILL